MNKFVRIKSPTGSKFSKIFLGQLYTGWSVVVNLHCGFSLWHQMAPQQSAKFRNAFFGQFRTSLRKDDVANYLCIDLDTVYDICYGTRGALQRTKHSHIRLYSVVGVTRFAKLWSRFCKA